MDLIFMEYSTVILIMIAGFALHPWVSHWKILTKFSKVIAIMFVVVFVLLGVSMVTDIIYLSVARSPQCNTVPSDLKQMANPPASRYVLRST